MSKSNAHTLIVSALDEVAWLTNLRGEDISHNPGLIWYDMVWCE